MSDLTYAGVLLIYLVLTSINHVYKNWQTTTILLQRNVYPTALARPTTKVMMNTATVYTEDTFVGHGLPGSGCIGASHRQHLGRATNQDTTSAFRSPASTASTVTLVETSDVFTPYPINDHDDRKVPIVTICSGGDLVVNIRRLGIEESLRPGARNLIYKVLARYRVSSVVLKAASRYVKRCLDSALIRTQFPTAVPLLRVTRDGNENLNLLIQSMHTMPTLCSASAVFESSGMAHGWRKAFATLMRVLHLNFDSNRSIKAKFFGVGVMAAMISELAYALGCVGPVVPWINLWLTRDLSMNSSTWYYSAKNGHYVGIVVGYIMGDLTAFQRWSRLCIQFKDGRDSESFAGLGFVWSLINRKFIIPTYSYYLGT